MAIVTPKVFLGTSVYVATLYWSGAEDVNHGVVRKPVRIIFRIWSI